MVPVLNGARLTLRPYTAADAPALYALRADPRVVRYTGVPLYTGVAQAQEFIARVNAGCATGEAVLWALVPAGESEPVGGVSLWNPSADRCEYDIGYELAPARQGAGLMGEAVRLALGHAFGAMGLRRVLADPLAENTASVRLLERCGFVQVAPREVGHLLFALESGRGS